MRTASVPALEAHAKKFGPEGVMETGVDLGLSVDQLVRLQKAIDKIEEQRDRGRRFSTYKKPRLTAEVRVKRLLGIEEGEGD